MPTLCYTFLRSVATGNLISILLFNVNANVNVNEHLLLYICIFYSLLMEICIKISVRAYLRRVQVVLSHVCYVLRNHTFCKHSKLLIT